MKKKLGLALAVKFGLIVFMFLLPFINVSCSGMVNVPLSGMDLAVGTTIETKEPFTGQLKEQKIDAEPFAAVALGAAIFGLLIGFVNTKPARVVNAIAGGLGAVFLLLLKSKIDKDVMREGGGMLAVNYDIGFWIAIVLFVLAVVLSMYAASISSDI